MKVEVLADGKIMVDSVKPMSPQTFLDQLCFRLGELGIEVPPARDLKPIGGLDPINVLIGEHEQHRFMVSFVTPSGGVSSKAFPDKFG